MSKFEWVNFNKELSLKLLNYKDNKKVVSGMMLYAKTDDEIQFDLTYFMSDIKISAKTLNPNQDLQIQKKHCLILLKALDNNYIKNNEY